MKKYFLYWLIVTFILTGCATPQPNLVHTHKPILNVAAPLAPLLDIRLHKESVSIKNKTNQQMSLTYTVTWYDQYGVTQLLPQGETEQQGLIQLSAQQQLVLPLVKPTEQSVNYRLYLVN